MDFLNIAKCFAQQQVKEKIKMLFFARALYFLSLMLKVYRVLVVLRITLDYIPYIKIYRKPWLTLERLVTPAYKFVNKRMRLLRFGQTMRLRYAGFILLSALDATASFLEDQAITFYARAYLL